MVKMIMLMLKNTMKIIGKLNNLPIHNLPTFSLQHSMQFPLSSLYDENGKQTIQIHQVHLKRFQVNLHIANQQNDNNLDADSTTFELNSLNYLYYDHFES